MNLWFWEEPLANAIIAMALLMAKVEFKPSDMSKELQTARAEAQPPSDEVQFWLHKVQTRAELLEQLRRARLARAIPREPPIARSRVCGARTFDYLVPSQPLG